MSKNRIDLIKQAAQKLKESKEPKRVSVLNNIPKVCNECGYVAKGEGLAMLEDFIAHRIAHPEWNSWVEGRFTC